MKRRLPLAGLVAVVLVVGGVLLGAAPRHPAPRDGAVLPGGAVVVYSPGYRISFFGIEKLHPFDITKYDRIARDLVRGGQVPEDGFAIPEEPDRARLERIHDPAYLDSLSDRRVLSEALEVTVPAIFPTAMIDARVLAPMRRSAGGTVVAARAALDHGLGINLGGGYHHARPDLGHGFCVYNDVALAITELRADGFAGRVLVVDTDAHQGDGNHAFFADDPLVTTFSMQQEGIFPQPRIPGDVDVELPAHTTDDAYLAELSRRLDGLLAEPPDLVFHVAGADVLHDDPLASLGLTIEGLVRRDRIVLDAVRGRGIPLVHVLAGGYGPSAAEAQARSVAGMLEAVR